MADFLDVEVHACCKEKNICVTKRTSRSVLLLGSSVFRNLLSSVKTESKVDCSLSTESTCPVCSHHEVHIDVFPLDMEHLSHDRKSIQLLVFLIPPSRKPEGLIQLISSFEPFTRIQKDFTLDNIIEWFEWVREFKVTQLHVKLDEFIQETADRLLPLSTHEVKGATHDLNLLPRFFHFLLEFKFEKSFHKWCHLLIKKRLLKPLLRTPRAAEYLSFEVFVGLVDYLEESYDLARVPPVPESVPLLTVCVNGLYEVFDFQSRIFIVKVLRIQETLDLTKVYNMNVRQSGTFRTAHFYPRPLGNQKNFIESKEVSEETFIDAVFPYLSTDVKTPWVLVHFLRWEDKWDVYIKASELRTPTLEKLSLHGNDLMTEFCSKGIHHVHATF